MSHSPSIKKIVRILGGILFFILIVGYGIWRGRDVLFGIRLSVVGITSGQSVTEPVFDLKGVAVHAKNVTVDGQGAILSEDGSWKETLALLPGYNTISIVAVDKFGKSVSKEIVLYYKAPPSPIVPDPTANSVTLPKTSPQPPTTTR
jgi:hypothetical protein